MDSKIHRLRKLKNRPGALGVGRDKFLWRTRRRVRKLTRFGRTVTAGSGPHIYKSVDEFAESFFPDFNKAIPRDEAFRQVVAMIGELGYTIVETNESKPWGGMYRLSDGEAGQFIHDFFPGLTLNEARLGRADVHLSPKFLLLAPGARLSWQYHNRRAERWHFLTGGLYYRSQDDIQPEPTVAAAGTIVQLTTGTRHRVASPSDSQYTLVAEVWQHTDPGQFSNEDDIVRLDDDYQRN